jgi:hypothetical protein
MTGLTLEAIEAREYTYCSATYLDPLRWEKFLVPMARNSAVALEQADAYAREMWGEPTTINLYPRNYVRKARELFAAGRFPGGEAMPL